MNLQHPYKDILESLILLIPFSYASYLYSKVEILFPLIFIPSYLLIVAGILLNFKSLMVPGAMIPFLFPFLSPSLLSIFLGEGSLLILFVLLGVLSLISASILGSTNIQNRGLGLFFFSLLLIGYIFKSHLASFRNIPLADLN